MAAFFLVAVMAVVGLAAGIVLVWREHNYWVKCWFWGMLILGMVGAVLGVFWVEYDLSPTERVIGFPIPGAIMQMRNGQWTDYINPLVWLNFVVVPGLSVLPATVLLWARWVRRRREARTRGFEVE